MKLTEEQIRCDHPEWVKLPPFAIMSRCAKCGHEVETRYAALVRLAALTEAKP